MLSRLSIALLSMAGSGLLFSCHLKQGWCLWQVVWTIQVCPHALPIFHPCPRHMCYYLFCLMLPLFMVPLVPCVFFWCLHFTCLALAVLLTFLLLIYALLCIHTFIAPAVSVSMLMRHYIQLSCTIVVLSWPLTYWHCTCFIAWLLQLGWVPWPPCDFLVLQTLFLLWEWFHTLFFWFRASCPWPCYLVLCALFGAELLFLLLLQKSPSK